MSKYIACDKCGTRTKDRRGWATFSSSRVTGAINEWDLCESCAIQVEAWISLGPDGPRTPASPAPKAPDDDPATSVIVNIDATRIAESNNLPSLLKDIQRGRA